LHSRLRKNSGQIDLLVGILFGGAELDDKSYARRRRLLKTDLWLGVLCVAAARRVV